MVEVGTVPFGDNAQVFDIWGWANEKKAQQPAPIVAKLRHEADLSEEEANLIRNFVPPRPGIPYPVKLNKHADEAFEATTQWLLRHKVDTQFEAGDFERFLKEESARLVTYMYASAGLDEMIYAAKMCVWLFLADHFIDDCEIGMDANSSLPLVLDLNLVILSFHPDDAVLYDNMMKIVNEFLPTTSSKRKQTLDFIQTQLHNARTIPGYKSDMGYKNDIGPLSTTLRDLLVDSDKMANETTNIRLARKTQAYLIGYIHEIGNREGNVVLRSQVYIPERRDSGAVQILWVMIDHVYHLETSDEVFSEMQELNDSHNDVILWHNDVSSFKKEALKGDAYNMLYLVSQEQKLSYMDAAVFTNKMIADRLADFDRAGEEMLQKYKHSEYYTKVIETYIETSQNFISGSEEFALITTRYK